MYFCVYINTIQIAKENSQQLELLFFLCFANLNFKEIYSLKKYPFTTKTDTDSTNVYEKKKKEKIVRSV